MKTLLYYIFFIHIYCLHALELRRVILASDTNPKYLEFWPLVARSWQKIVGLRPTLALIAPKGTHIDASLGDVIRFDPIPGVSTALHAQVIRLFLPFLFPQDGCIISDMDMIPLSKKYFTESIRHCPQNSFVIYRDRATNNTQYPMCYIAALGSTYSEIFSIRSINDIQKIVMEWAHATNTNWFTDQLMLRKYADTWGNQTGRLVKLGHKTTKRIDRARWEYNAQHLRQGWYIDAHLPRPYSKHRAQIQKLCTELGIFKKIYHNRRPISYPITPD